MRRSATRLATLQPKREDSCKQRNSSIEINAVEVPTKVLIFKFCLSALNNWATYYLLNHQKDMRYDEYLAAGLLMDGAARWSLQGTEALLRLRAHRSSGDFADYWSYHVAQE